MSAYLWLLVGIALAAIGTMATFAMLHVRANLRQWSRYAMPQGSGTLVPVMCPHCRQRTYSPRAIREGFCPNCGKHH